MSSPTQNKGFTYPANGAQVNVWDSLTLNPNYVDIDTALGGRAYINVVGVSGIQVFTRAQYLPPLIVFQGALTANVTYQFPAGIGWNGIIANQTSGAFTVTIGSATGGGGSVTIPQGYQTGVICDGISGLFANTRPVAAAGGGGQIQFNQSGLLGASANFAWDNTNQALNITGTGSGGGLSVYGGGNIWVANGAIAIGVGNVNLQSGILQAKAPAGNVGLYIQGATGVHSAQIADTAGNMKKVGYLNIPYGGNGGWQSSSYTCVLSDAGGTLGFSGSGLTCAIPANSVVPYDLMTTLTILTWGYPLTITCGDQMVLAGSSGPLQGNRTLGAYGICTAVKVNATSWMISGPGLS